MPSNFFESATNLFDRWWKKSVDGAPPPTRYFDLSYAPLLRVNEEDGTEVPVGSFVPELYELAKAGQLRVQIEGKAADKDPFELAILPTSKNAEIAERVSEEYRYRRNEKLPLPAHVSKFQILQNYLENMEEIGLKPAKFPMQIKVNMNLPTDKATLREKLIHYASQWAAQLIALQGVAALGITSPLIYLACAAAIYLAQKPLQDFGFFDAAEALHRDIGWLTDKKLGRGEKIDYWKATKTLFYVSVTAAMAYFSATALFASTAALQVWPALSSVGVPAMLVGALQYSLASFLAASSVAMAWCGLTVCVRYFEGLSFWDNQIVPPLRDPKIYGAEVAGAARAERDELKQVVSQLPVEVGKGLDKALQRKLNACIHEIRKTKYGLTEKQQTRLIKDLENAFEPSQEKAIRYSQSKAEKAANDPKEQLVEEVNEIMSQSPKRK